VSGLLVPEKARRSGGIVSFVGCAMMLIGRLEQVRIVHFGLFQTHSLSDFSDPGAQVRANRSNACATERIGRALDRGLVLG